MTYEIIEIRNEDVMDDMLDTFDRRQVVSKRYCIKNSVKTLENIDFIDDWSLDERRQIVNDYIRNAYEKSLYATGVRINGKLAGFMVLDCHQIGPNDEYAELKQLHVSQKHRHMGIGKALFYDAVEKARDLKFSKLYISAHSAYETQVFYEDLGCICASWLYPKAVESEPYDIQMEYVL